MCWCYRNDGKYDLDFKTSNNDGSQKITGEQLSDYYVGWSKNYPIVSIEDPFDQDDWDNWTNLSSKTEIQVIKPLHFWRALGTCEKCMSDIRTVLSF